jgi:transposase
MVMLAEQYRYVIGGDPDRDTVDLAIVDTRTGHVTAHFVDSADATGYARMLTWAVTRAPDARVWALEGTGNYAAGLAAFLADAGEDVVEAGAGKRARGAKSDRIDAERPPAGPWRVSTRRRPASEGSARRCEWC